MTRLSAREAVALVKHQAQCFVKEVYPFDRPCSHEEHPQHWWNEVAKNLDSQPLAVSSLSFYGISIS
jgi:hypothetical protein